LYRTNYEIITIPFGGGILGCKKS